LHHHHMLRDRFESRWRLKVDRRNSCSLHHFSLLNSWHIQSTMMPAVPTWLTFVQFIKNNWKIRVSSVHHVNTSPFVQFGETSDVYLYLSQRLQ
jgi:hypothetical protein